MGCATGLPLVTLNMIDKYHIGDEKTEIKMCCIVYLGTYKELIEAAMAMRILHEL